MLRDVVVVEKVLMGHGRDNGGGGSGRGGNELLGVAAHRYVQSHRAEEGVTFGRRGRDGGSAFVPVVWLLLLLLLSERRQGIELRGRLRFDGRLGARSRRLRVVRLLGGVFLRRSKLKEGFDDGVVEVRHDEARADDEELIARQRSLTALREELEVLLCDGMCRGTSGEAGAGEESCVCQRKVLR